MKIKISLTNYLADGGDLTKLNPFDIICNFDSNKRQVKSIEFDGVSPKSNAKMYKIEFADGYIHSYAELWFEVQVDLILNPKYLKI